MGAKFVAGKYFQLSFVFAFATLLCHADLPDYCGKNPAKKVNIRVPGEINGYELKQVNLFIRHGDRTKASYPVNTGYCWPEDTADWDCTLTSFSHPTIKHDQHSLNVDRVYRKVYLENRQPMKGDCPLGALTFKGYGQQEMNGAILNKLYVKTGFLKQNLSFTDMYVRSDDMHRTMQSAQSLIRGMYPPAHSTSDKAEVVDIKTMDPTFDDIEPNSKLCPRFAEYQRDVLKTPQFLNHFYNVTKPILQDLQKALNYSEPIGLDEMDSIVDCVHTHQCHNFDVPAAITDELFERMLKDIAYRETLQLTYPTRQKLSQVGIGFLVDEMWQFMQKKIAGTGPKFVLFSGHDYTLYPLLVAFNISDGTWPPYASMLRFELHQSTSSKNNAGSYAVRIVYNDKELKPPFCEQSPCDMATFEKYLESIVPVDSAHLCRVQDQSIMKGPLGRLRRYPTKGMF